LPPLSAGQGGADVFTRLDGHDFRIACQRPWAAALEPIPGGRDPAEGATGVARHGFDIDAPVAERLDAASHVTTGAPR